MSDFKNSACKCEKCNDVFRVFVEKKADFAIESGKLRKNLQVVFGIKNVKQVRIFNRYDVMGVDFQIFEKAKNGVFCEPQVDYFYDELPKLDGFIFACEFLPGQYDARADFCQQCLQLLSVEQSLVSFNGNKISTNCLKSQNIISSKIKFDEIKVKTAKIFCFEGNLTSDEFEKIKHYLINPVECRQADLQNKAVFNNNFEPNVEIQTLENFNELNEVELKEFLIQKSLAMDFSDLQFCQNYFKNVEKRPPTMAEIKVIDTYWSDHCRHTTFLTSLEKIEIVDKRVKKVFNSYLKLRKNLNLNEFPISLMSLATIAVKKMKVDGGLNELDESDEINACSVNVEVETSCGAEKWLLVFKNETHNHPTEIEPFGGAATCIGGAIRDPLSARAYVFNAMRISGSADPLQPVEQTLKGKLPQIKIVTTAAEGYSSYGNQIGVATGFVQEIYHSGFVAKHLELGAVVGAVLKNNVVKQKPQEGDAIVLIGGKTGRDGCEGAVGSSKFQTTSSVDSCGAQVQKGNPVEERKLQRFVKNSQVVKLIKRCNDFGAGGVCVAIGELADGVKVNLNAVPKKYDGLNEVDLAISESQERMAVVVAKQNLQFFLAQAAEENLMATKVAEVLKQKRLILTYFEKNAVNLSREFLNSNGVLKKAAVETSLQNFSLRFKFENSEIGWLKFFSNLNFCSQKGLVEMFDSTIGAGCVLMPYGGKYQSTKAQAMVSLFPTKKTCKTVSAMAYGFDPFLMEQSPFFGAQYAVIESIAKLVACGASLSKCWLTFQEYFPSVGNDPKLWGQPFLALLGAFNAQVRLNVASIGGKDSMSGTFEQLKVPPTFVSFAVGVFNLKNVVSAEFKKVGSQVALVLPEFGACFEPNYDSLIKVFSLIESLVLQKKVLSVYALGSGGIVKAICEMCFGNRIGFKFYESFDVTGLEVCWFGGFLVELSDCFSVSSVENFEIIGQTVSDYYIYQKGFKVSLLEIEKIAKRKLESVFPTKPFSFSKQISKQIMVRTITYDKFKKVGSKVGLLFLKVPENKNEKLQCEEYFKKCLQTLINSNKVLSVSLKFDFSSYDDIDMVINSMVSRIIGFKKHEETLEFLNSNKFLDGSNYFGCLIEFDDSFDFEWSCCREVFKGFSAKLRLVGNTVSSFVNVAYNKKNVKVLVPIFPGTNCEFDLISKFEQAGAICEQFIFNNLSRSNILSSVKEFVLKLRSSNIVALAGGFSAGDEPDGSAKFICAFFRNALVRVEIEKFLNLNDGLMIGICNGFQALVKLGLIEHGKIVEASEVRSTLTYNEIGRHQSKLVRTRVCCCNSPWLSNSIVGKTYIVPVSNGEGRFIAPSNLVEKLIKNGQIATQYVDFKGKASMLVEHNPSGSSMAIEGLISPNGRIFGRMGHSERVCEGLFKNVPNVEEQKIFSAGVEYFKKI